MGVRQETYLLWGWLLPYETFDAKPEDEKEAIYDLPGGYRPKVGEVARLIDGMSGRYVAVGRVEARADDDGDGIEPMKIEARVFEGDREAVYNAVKVFEPLPGEPGFVLLTHWH